MAWAGMIQMRNIVRFLLFYNGGVSGSSETVTLIYRITLAGGTLHAQTATLYNKKG